MALNAWPASGYTTISVSALAARNAWRIVSIVYSGILPSCAPYKPSTGAPSWVATSTGCLGIDNVLSPVNLPYQAAAALVIGDCAPHTASWIELQMSHIERNGVKAAYLHTTKYLEERRLMMQWWADYLDANRESYISLYDFARRNKQR